MIRFGGNILAAAVGSDADAAQFGRVSRSRRRPFEENIVGTTIAATAVLFEDGEDALEEIELKCQSARIDRPHLEIV